MPNQEPASAWIFGNGSVRVSTQGLFRRYLKTFVPPFLPTRLTAPGSPRMEPKKLIIALLASLYGKPLLLWPSLKMNCQLLSIPSIKYVLPKRNVRVKLSIKANLSFIFLARYEENIWNAHVIGGRFEMGFSGALSAHEARTSVAP